MKKTLLRVLFLFIILNMVFSGYTYASGVSTDKEIDIATSSKILFANENTQQNMVTELVKERTLFSKKYLLENGDYREEYSLVPIHYEDGKGNYMDIDTQLIENLALPTEEMNPSKDSLHTYHKYSEMRKQGKKTKLQLESEASYSAYNVPFDINISKDISKGYSIGKEDEKITFIPIDANSSTGTVINSKKNKMLFRNVWKSTDLELEITNLGIKENIVLKDEQAPRSFKFSINKNKENSENLLMLPSYLFDKNNIYREVKTNTINEENGVSTLEILFDDTGLTYPITIDPTTTILPIRAIYVDQEFPDTGFSFNSVMKVSSSSYSKISYLQYDLQPSLLNTEVKVSSATLQLYAKSISNNNGVVPRIQATQFYDNPLTNGSWTYNKKPGSMYSRGNSSNIVSIQSQGFYNFDVTPMFESIKVKESGNVVMSLNEISSSGSSSIIEFVTPWSSDPNKFPKLTVTYGTPQPVITNTNVTKNEDGTILVSWGVSEVPGSSQTKFEMILLKYYSESQMFMEIDRVNNTSILKQYLWKTISGGDYRFAIRTYNGTAWSEWGFTESIKMQKGTRYIYDAANRLKYIIDNIGGKTTFIYDNQGNLLKENFIPGINGGKLIADGDPIEWVDRKNCFMDYVDDFFNVEEEKEPERDISSVYYDVDGEYLYIMIGLGRTKDNEILNPHSNDNDNYFVYLPANNSGNSYSRNRTPLNYEVSYEIASWHNDDVTVHTFDKSTYSWKWNWTGSYIYDGLKSVKVIEENIYYDIYTSAILEMRIPLSYIPGADIRKMIVVAGSDKYDMDIAYNNN